MQTDARTSPSQLPADPLAADPLAGRIRLARAALAWERLWLALWPAVAFAGLFVVIALFDILPVLPAWLHAGILIAFAGVTVWAVWRVRAAFALPASEAGRRRLEIASGMEHRPLFALRDRLAGGANDPIARSLWEAHRARVRKALKVVRVGWPSPGLPARDPFALRAALVLLLLVGIGIAGSDVAPRVGRALVPGSGGPPVPPGALDLWITPPSYTGLAPLLPKAEPGQASTEIAVPVGSALLAQVTGGRGAPHLVIDDKDVPFQAIDGSSTGGNAQQAWRVGATLNAGKKLVIKQGHGALASWTLKIVPDQPPTIEVIGKPAQGQRAALRFDYKTHDDYGVASATATIRRKGEAPAGAPGQPIDLPLGLSSQNAKDATGQTYQDLTAHPWAGLRVILQLRATDAAGQTGVSEPIEIALPERKFQNPVARAIVEQR